MKLLQNREMHKNETCKILFAVKIDGNYTTREENTRIKHSNNFTQLQISLLSTFTFKTRRAPIEVCLRVSLRCHFKQQPF